MPEEEEGPDGVFGLYGEFEESAKDLFSKDVVSSRTVLALMLCDILWGLQNEVAALAAACAPAPAPTGPRLVQRGKGGPN